MNFIGLGYGFFAKYSQQKRSPCHTTHEKPTISNSNSNNNNNNWTKKPCCWSTISIIRRVIQFCIKENKTKENEKEEMNCLHGMGQAE